MARAIGFLMFVGAGVLAVIIGSGASVGSLLALPVGRGVEHGALSPLAVSYGGAGVMVGFVMANLMRISWLDMPRRAWGWMCGQKRRFEMFVFGCLFCGILLFY